MEFKSRDTQGNLQFPDCGPEILRFRLTIIQFLRKSYILINAETLSQKRRLGMDNGRKLLWAIRNKQLEKIFHSLVDRFPVRSLVKTVVRSAF